MKGMGRLPPVCNEARPRERSDRDRFLPFGQKSLFIMRPFFAFRQQKPLHTGVRTVCHYLISLSVCQCAFNEFAFSNSFVDPVSEQPAWTRRRGSDSQPICPPRTRAHLSPPGIPFSVLPPEKFGVSS